MHILLLQKQKRRAETKKNEPKALIDTSQYQQAYEKMFYLIVFRA